MQIFVGFLRESCQLSNDNKCSCLRPLMRAYKGNLRVECGAPSGIQGQCPWWRSLWSWRPFVNFHTKEGPKVKDFSNCSPPCRSTRRKTVTFGQSGAAAQSAHAWIRFCTTALWEDISIPYCSGPAVLFPCTAELGTVSHSAMVWKTECPWLLWSKAISDFVGYQVPQTLSNSK